MYCHRCGKELPEIARFCPACGSPVLDSTSTPEAVEAPADPVQAPEISRPNDVMESTRTAEAVQAQADLVKAPQISRPSAFRQGKRVFRTRFVLAIVFSVVAFLFVFRMSGSGDLVATSVEAASGLWVAAFLYRAHQRRKSPLDPPISGVTVLLVGVLGALGISAGGRLILEIENRQAASDLKLIKTWQATALQEIGRGAEVSPAPRARSHAGKFLIGWHELDLGAGAEVSQLRPTPTIQILTDAKEGKVITPEALKDEIRKRHETVSIYRITVSRMRDYAARCEDSAAWQGWPQGWTREVCAVLQPALKAPTTPIDIAELDAALLEQLAKAPKFRKSPVPNFDSATWSRELTRLAEEYDAAVGGLPQAQGEGGVAPGSGEGGIGTNVGRVARITVAKSINADDSPRLTGDTFGPHDTVYVTMWTSGPVGTSIMARWAGPIGEQLTEDTVVLDRPGDGYTSFHASHMKGWAPGSYEVEILVNGLRAGVARFTVL